MRAHARTCRACACAADHVQLHCPDETILSIDSISKGPPNAREFTGNVLVEFVSNGIREKIFRKLKYAMVLLEEVAKCGGAPIKHKNWTIVSVCVCACSGWKGTFGMWASGSFVPALFVCVLTWFMLPSR